jgi:hypothetical protein
MGGLTPNRARRPELRAVNRALSLDLVLQPPAGGFSRIKPTTRRTLSTRSCRLDHVTPAPLAISGSGLPQDLCRLPTTKCLEFWDFS